MTLTIARPARKIQPPKCDDCRHCKRDFVTGYQFAKCRVKTPAHAQAKYCSIIRNPEFDCLGDRCGSRGFYFQPKRTIWQRIKNLWERDPQP